VEWPVNNYGKGDVKTEQPNAKGGKGGAKVGKGGEGGDGRDNGWDLTLHNGKKVKT